MGHPAATGGGRYQKARFRRRRIIPGGALRSDQAYILRWHVALTVWLALALACQRGPASAPAASSSQPAAGVPSPEDRLIRILVAGDKPGFTVTTGGACQWVDPGTGQPVAEVPAGASFSVGFGETGVGAPHLPASVALETVDLLPRRGRPCTLAWEGQAAERFPGRLRFIRSGPGVGHLVNLVDIEDYLAAVVAAELDRRYHRETFRAQAIAARTYAWYQKETRSSGSLWDMTATERSQVYAGLARLEQVPQAGRAVRDTYGLVCTWESPDGWRIFCTYYSSSCGGRTQSADAIRRGSAIAPLAGNVACPCGERDNSRWDPLLLSKTFVTDQLRSRYSRFASLGRIQRIEVREATDSGRPVIITLADEADQELDLEAENFRLAIDPTGRQFRSTLFTLADDGAGVRMEAGRGFGHGVGLCQTGAEILARQGHSAGQILRHYYPTSRLRRAY